MTGTTEGKDQELHYKGYQCVDCGKSFEYEKEGLVIETESVIFFVCRSCNENP